jgi:hypothetical protein
MRALSFLIAMAATLLVPAGTSAPAAAAATDFPICWMAPSPGTGWTYAGYDFDRCKDCKTEGAAGIDRGDWDTYLCGFFPIGLDGVYKLYVPTPAE